MNQAISTTRTSKSTFIRFLMAPKISDRLSMLGLVECPAGLLCNKLQRLLCGLANLPCDAVLGQPDQDAGVLMSEGRRNLEDAGTACNLAPQITQRAITALDFPVTGQGSGAIDYCLGAWRNLGSRLAVLTVVPMIVFLEKPRAPPPTGMVSPVG